MSDMSLPTAIHSTTLRLFGVDIRVHVLSDGERVIEADSMADLLEAMAEPAADEDSQAELERFARWLHGLDEAPPEPARHDTA